MKSVIFSIITAAALFAVACSAQNAKVKNAGRNSDSVSQPAMKHAVLVELFTSEGCSSCPPADRTLAFLSENQPVRDVEIIPLAFHVDYWDRLGWKDPFSSALFTQRQEKYAQHFQIDSAYTPQMVVDGESQFVGSQQGKANNEIAEAGARVKGKVDAFLADGMIKVNVVDLPDHKDSTVFLAVTEA